MNSSEVWGESSEAVNFNVIIVLVIEVVLVKRNPSTSAAVASRWIIGIFIIVLTPGQVVSILIVVIAPGQIMGTSRGIVCLVLVGTTTHLIFLTAPVIMRRIAVGYRGLRVNNRSYI